MDHPSNNDYTSEGTFKFKGHMKDAKEREALRATLDQAPATSMIYYVDPESALPVALQCAFLWVKHYIFRRPL